MTFSKKTIGLGAAALAVGLTALVVKMALAIPKFDPVDSPIGYVGQDDLTNFNLKSGTEVLFRGEYGREYWTGTLFAYPIKSNGDIGGAGDYWAKDAASMLQDQNFNTGRFIATMKGDGTGVPFRWDNLTSTQKDAIGQTNGSKVVDFVRGDRSNELSQPDGIFRTRASAMGDIVHSRPYYVSDASSSSPAPTVFVGANDGMLHAIHAGSFAKKSDGTLAQDSEGGRERWAYVPSMLIPKLSKLTVDPYVHQYYVDGQINIATAADGRRILVGGLGAGGKGLYALDISSLAVSSESDVASKVMWEITPTRVNYAAPSSTNAYVNLGYTYGTMTLAKVNGKDVVIVGNGYNNGDNDNAASYAGCTHGSPSYANCGGDYGSWLFIIDVTNGQLISKISAGTGNAANPNGLSTPVAVDSDGDGSVDRVYAGDLNGTMWKFSIAADGTLSKSALLVTDPAQPITSTPGVALHPNGGYMVNFGTGKMLVPADVTDSTQHYVYGVWDGAPSGNTGLVTQQLETRDYLAPGASVSTLKVRRVLSQQKPNWASGGHRGWKVALPAGGERVVGEGSFIENGRFYFAAHNPTIEHAISGTDSVVKGDNWLMELDYLSGGAATTPYLDLSGDQELDNEDRLTYATGDTIPTGATAGDRILSTDGIPVGKYLARGLLSQPVLVQLATLNDTLYNQNPDITVHLPEPERGVAGGHFDVEYFYIGAEAVGRITVGTNGQTSGYPATMGEIKVGDKVVFPAMTVTDLKNGTDALTNAKAIAAKVMNGFSASVETVKIAGVTRYRIVVTAPATGTELNGATFTIADGTSQTLVAASNAVAAVPPTGFITFSGSQSGSNAEIRKTLFSSSASVGIGSNQVVAGSAISIGSSRTPAQAAAKVVADIGTSGSVKAYIGGNSVTAACKAKDSKSVCLVDYTNAPNYDGANGRAITVGTTSSNFGLSITLTATAGGVTAKPKTEQSGWTDLKSALSVTSFTGGVDNAGDDCGGNTNTLCTYRQHLHEYDDIFDKTGVNFLNPSSPNYVLSKAIPKTDTAFKVLMANQYLSPAVEIHIGDATYDSAKRAGYKPVRDFQTTSTLKIADVPTYTRANIGSLALNMPVDAFTPKNWWGASPADVRVGLHPTEPYCVWESYSPTEDGNMFQPVIPPSGVTADGNGTPGFGMPDSDESFKARPTTTKTVNGTVVTAATGVRHNGALTVQIIRDTTPQSAIELNVAGRPEYGWRVNSDEFKKYVLAEYTIFWHTKHLGVCYGDTLAGMKRADKLVGNTINKVFYYSRKVTSDWSKLPIEDNRGTCVEGAYDTQTVRACLAPSTSNVGTDPKIGELKESEGGTLVSNDVKTVDNVTTTVRTYTDGFFIKIVRTANKDQTVTIETTSGYGDPSKPGSGTTTTTKTIANSAGSNATGGDERGLQARTGRVSWRELVLP